MSERDRAAPPEGELSSAPEVPDVRPERSEFPCKNCGAETSWDPDADALLCAYCGASEPVPRGEGTVVERALEDAGSAARGLGLATRVARCTTCGAAVTFDGATVATRCVYCGSPSVLDQEANRNALRPESLVPLDVGREQVEQGFHRWRKGLWFRPNALRRVERFDAAGVYVPFWTFDCAVHSAWSANAGYFYWVTQTYRDSDGRTRTRRVRRIRWVPAWGERYDRYDDELVLASKGLPSSLVAELGRFDTSALVPYRPEYLAGWRAEEYQLDLEEGWRLAQERVEASQRVRCAGDVPGDTHADLRVRSAISGVRWKHVLLPVWSLQYAFRGRTYTVLVHGQTGRVVGKAPYSWAKILGAVLVLALVAALVLLFARR